MGFATEYLDAGGGLLAGADLSAKQYHLVKKDTSGRNVILPADATEQVLGVLQNAPESGQPATVAIVGATKFVCGGTVTEGDMLMSDAADDGKVIPHTSGNVAVGIAAQSGVDGETIQGWVLPLGDTVTA